MTAVLDAGAEDLNDDEDTWAIVSSQETFTAVLAAVKKLEIEPVVAELAMLPQNYVRLEGKTAQQIIKLLEALEDHDDVRHVWSNVDIAAKEIEASLA